MKSKICVVVDGYSTGRFLPLEFKKYGINCVHVQSTRDIPQFFKPSFHANHFIDSIIYERDIEKILQSLSKFDIAFVIPGCDLGVELADVLSEKLGLPSNGTKYSSARRNKFEMGEVIRDFGIRAVNQIKSANLEEILSWVKDTQEWPVVLKPTSSVCTDNVIFCDCEDDVISAFKRIVGNINACGIKNNEVLAQEFLSGTEYIVNTVSVAGEHYVTDIWQYGKLDMPGYSKIYDFLEILPLDGRVQKELSKYTKQVLDALRIQFGACHSEVMMTDNGPVLIETNARLMGVIIPEVVSKAIQSNHVEQTVKSYVEPEIFKTIINQPLSERKNLLIVILISEIEGKIKSISHIDKIRNLPSFCDMKLQLEKDKPIKKTVDLVSSPGYIFLVHENPEVIQQDYQTIRHLEKNGLYNVAQTVSV
ncbi:MAG: ATP-grasp domain-containing protein [Sphaerospermopsis sp. SIO1G2]|nr:ATP-grasp domain-containing protein [Sphaerospermopsis sp. SIO1G2]